MAQVFPQIADAKIDYGWGGAVAVTMNRLPHIGRRGNIFYAHGFSGHGALVTTLAGELIAEAMAGTAERFDVLANRSEEHTSELQSLMSISYAVFCLKKKKTQTSPKQRPI